jgi:hypothetical protein
MGAWGHRSDSDQGMQNCPQSASQSQIHVPSGGKNKKFARSHHASAWWLGPTPPKFITKPRGKCQSPLSVIRNLFPFTPQLLLCSLVLPPRRRPRSGLPRRVAERESLRSSIPGSKLRVSTALNLAKFGSVCLYLWQFPIFLLIDCLNLAEA